MARIYQNRLPGSSAPYRNRKPKPPRQRRQSQEYQPTKAIVAEAARFFVRGAMTLLQIAGLLVLRLAIWILAAGALLALWLQLAVAAELASLNRRSENIRVGPIVIFELTFRNVERQIFGTDLVITADDAALEDRPETFNRVRVNRTDNVLAGAVFHGSVRIFVQAEIALKFVSREQADFVADNFANEFLHVIFADGLQNAGNNAAFTLHSADDWRLGRERVAAWVGRMVNHSA